MLYGVVSLRIRLQYNMILLTTCSKRFTTIVSKRNSANDIEYFIILISESEEGIIDQKVNSSAYRTSQFPLLNLFNEFYQKSEASLADLIQTPSSHVWNKQTALYTYNINIFNDLNNFLLMD